MTKFVALFTTLTVSSLVFASPDYSSISAKLYPNNTEDRAFTAKFFQIVEAHKTKDPLLEGVGPSISEYSLDKIKFAFMANETAHNVDLFFFNWNLPMFDGLEVEQELSIIYGKTVYVLKNVDKKSIASQGENNDLLTNFSYLLGANYIETQIKRDAPPNFQVPQELLDWKPHAKYMDRSHPLRQALNTHTLAILSPSKELFFERTGLPENMRIHFEQSLESKGGFYNSIMGMMVHEMYHVKEGVDHVNNLAKRRKIDEDRQTIIDQLKSDAKLRRLMTTYTKIIFSLGDSLKLSSDSNEQNQLSDLKLVINELKTKYSEAWKFIWNYEYKEGFAEYASAHSMIQVGITSLEKQIDLQKSDDGNNFAYRTGALGGLYLANRLKVMPFKNNEDHRESVWEIILRLNQTPISQADINSIESKYSLVPDVDGESEIDRVTEYLTSTVMDI